MNPTFYWLFYGLGVAFVVGPILFLISYCLGMSHHSPGERVLTSVRYEQYKRFTIACVKLQFPFLVMYWNRSQAKPWDLFCQFISWD